MLEIQKMVKNFHEKFGQVINDKPRMVDEDTHELRVNIMQEELDEITIAENIVEVADGIADLIYTALGTAVSYGIDIEPIIEEIHHSNMTKDGGGKRSDGKVLKGDLYRPPNIATILMKQMEDN